MKEPAPVFQADELRALFMGESQAQDEGGSADLFKYWGIILKHKWGILSIVLIAGIVSTIYTYTLEPKYIATATLLFEPKQRSYGTVQDVITNDAYSIYRAQQSFLTQQQIMRSRGFAEKVVDRLELWDHPYFDPTVEKPKRAVLQIDWQAWVPEWFDWLVKDDAPALVAPPQAERRRAAISAIQAGISIDEVKNTLLLKVGFTSLSPEFSADAANALAELFIEYDLEGRLESFKNANIWFTERMSGLREDLKESEAKLQEYRVQQELVNIGEGSSILDREMEDVFSRLTAARTRLTELENQYGHLDALRKVPAVEAADNPTLLSLGDVRGAKLSEEEARRELSKLGLRYGPKHPKMIAAEFKHKDALDRLEKAVSAALSGERKQYLIARNQERQLEEEFNSLKEKSGEIGQKKFQLSALERSTNADRELYDLFLTRFKETNVASDVSSPNARFIERARVPGSFFWPNPRRMIAIGMGGALFVGILLAFLLEFLDNTIRQPEDIEERLGLPLLGTLMFLQPGRRKKKQESTPERMFLEQKKSVFSETIRTIRTGVVLSGLDNPHKIVTVTSTVPGEGKTTVSINLAVALGQLDKVLLIDADMRRATLGSHFGIDKKAPGLSDLVAGTQPMTDCIHHFEDSKIDVLPAGTIPPNPQELLSSARFSKYLTELSEKYDRIVIDTAPATLVSDALLVAKESSAVVYVIRAEYTPYQLIREGLKRLQKLDTPVVGAVLNQMSMQKAGRYGRYGRYRRYGRYGYSRYGGYSYDGYAQHEVYGDRKSEEPSPSQGG